MSITALTRWDPFRDLFSIQERLNRVFGDPLSRFPIPDTVSAWYPPVDIYEEDDRIVVRAELPGVSKDDIDVNVESGTITLRGEKKQEKKVDSDNVYRVERFYGSFSRSFALPSTIDPGKIEARYKDGVLEVVLPKAEEARPRRISVR
ncbi:MAG: Hsp20/alpha crystallin family protein [Acidobacteriota bacterium]